jgi:adhesin transport system outer membrane protein
MSIHAKRRLVLSAALILGAAVASPAAAIDLKDAVATAVASNPDIETAAQDKQAIEMERKQAQGLWLPRLDLELQGGVESLDNPNRRLLGLNGHVLYPSEADLIGQETLWDSGYRRSELERQAARTDSAAHHVQERAEFIGLDVVRAYLNFLLQQRLYALAQDNIAFHEQTVGDLRQGVSSGSLSIADQQQAEERLQAARARLTDAQEQVLEAAIVFKTRTGVALDNATLPPPITLPASEEDAVALARTANPKVRIAQSDIDAAEAFVRETKASLWPKISLEASGRIGNDVDGFEGKTDDVIARVVLRWNIYSGGVTQANIQEQIRRSSEQYFRLHEVVREVDDDVQEAWTRKTQQQILTGQLDQQARISDDLVSSYREQFKVGRRSLLDLLDSQNTRYNSQVLAETARFAELFAEYKVLAATGTLLDTLGVPHPKDAAADASQTYHVPPTPPMNLDGRYHPGQ